LQPKPVLLREKERVEYLDLACKSILNYCDTRWMPDTFTINPYRGCEFGCSYCYARYTHEFMELEWAEFKKKIFLKRQGSQVLLRSLDPGKIAGRHIAIGTATDPYQPAEARFFLTRKLLEVFARARNLSLSITTKSSLVKRDIPLFQQIARNNHLQVNISLISLDEKFLADLEPKASHPEARLKALSEITQAGIRAGILMMPILPGITDSPENLESVVCAAKRNGAHYLGSNVWFLRESAKRILFEFLRRKRPGMYRGYCRSYGTRSYYAEGLPAAHHDAGSGPEGEVRFRPGIALRQES
jgi:DNA repair photolyase